MVQYTVQASFVPTLNKVFVPTVFSVQAAEFSFKTPFGLSCPFDLFSDILFHTK